jgi:hypothetical protein
MSRSHKGAKGIGWEPHDFGDPRTLRELERVSYVEEPADWQEDECRGCPACICRMCGGHITKRLLIEEPFSCISCGYQPPEANELESE